MMIGMFVALGVLCGLAGVIWGQRHPRIFVHPVSEDSKRFDFLNARASSLANARGYWSVAVDGKILCTNPDIRAAIDHAMKRVTEAGG